MLRTVADQPSLWEAVLPSELLQLPQESAGSMRCWIRRRISVVKGG